MCIYICKQLNVTFVEWILDEEPFELSYIKLLVDEIDSENDGYCFPIGTTDGQLTEPIKSGDLLHVLCVSKEGEATPPAAASDELSFPIASVKVAVSGADLDWGPIGVERAGFVNVFGRRASSVRLECQANSTSPLRNVRYRWLRDGAYMSHYSQVKIRCQFSQQHLVKNAKICSCR